MLKLQVNMRFCLRSLALNVNNSQPKALSKSQEVGKTVYLTHVKWVTGKHQLKHYFSRFGRIRSVNLFFDAETGLHRGFASVTFKHTESANRAMEERPHVIDGDMVCLEPYVPMVSKRKDIVVDLES